LRGTQGTCRRSIPAKGELRVGVYYYDSAPVYPPGAMIYDPQTGMVWVPAHFERVGDSVVWVPARWEPLRRRS